MAILLFLSAWRVQPGVTVRGCLGVLRLRSEVLTRCSPEVLSAMWRQKGANHRSRFTASKRAWKWSIPISIYLYVCIDAADWTFGSAWRLKLSLGGPDATVGWVHIFLKLHRVALDGCQQVVTAMPAERAIQPSFNAPLFHWPAGGPLGVAVWCLRKTQF